MKRQILCRVCVAFAVLFGVLTGGLLPPAAAAENQSGEAAWIYAGGPHPRGFSQAIGTEYLENFV